MEASWMACVQVRSSTHKRRPHQVTRHPAPTHMEPLPWRCRQKGESRRSWPAAPGSPRRLRCRRWGPRPRCPPRQVQVPGPLGRLLPSSRPDCRDRGRRGRDPPVQSRLHLESRLALALAPAPALARRRGTEGTASTRCMASCGEACQRCGLRMEVAGQGMDAARHVTGRA